jgi:hypothetical protein
MKLSEAFRRPKTATPVSIEDRNRRGKGVQGAGQFDFERHASSLAAPPPPPPATKEQWEDAGYDWADQDRLERVGLTPDEADAWRDKSFGVFDIVDWSRSGFALEEAAIWKDEGIEAGEAKTWKDSGVALAEAAMLKASGIEAGEAKTWKDSGVALAEAAMLKASKVKLADANKLKDAGLNAEEASQWVKAISGDRKHSYVDPEESDETWASDEVLSWRGAEFSLEDTKSWCSSGFKLKNAVILRRNEISTEEATQWGEVTREATEIIQWKKAGCSPQDARKWNDLAIARRPEEVKALQDAGITLEEAEKYNIAAQYSTSEAIRLKKTGADLDKVIEEQEKEWEEAREAKKKEKNREGSREIWSRERRKKEIGDDGILPTKPRHGAMPPPPAPSSEQRLRRLRKP